MSELHKWISTIDWKSCNPMSNIA